MSHTFPTKELPTPRWAMPQLNGKKHRGRPPRVEADEAAVAAPSLSGPSGTLSLLMHHDAFPMERGSPVDALLRHERFSGECWDPVCGEGVLVRALKRSRLECWGSDNTDKGFGAVTDFSQLDASAGPLARNIISCPPASMLDAFIRHAIWLAGHKVALLTRLSLFEQSSRYDLLRTTPLTQIWLGSGADHDGQLRNYAWFIWEHGHVGPAVVGIL